MARRRPDPAGRIALVPDPDRPQAWTVFVDGAPQSHVDLADPRRLEFEYVRWLSWFADLGAGAGEPLNVLHLGGGAWTLARYVAATRPGSRQRVVEIDGELVETVRRELPGARRDGVRVQVGDARQVLAGLRPATVDLLVVDAFGGARIPPHLTSTEFVTLAAAVLRPGGVYAANVADGAPLRFARSLTATVGAVFDEVAMVAPPAVLRGRRFGNLVLAGSTVPMPLADLGRRGAADAFPVRVLDDAECRRFAGGAEPVTDATAGPSPEPPAGWLDGY